MSAVFNTYGSLALLTSPDIEFESSFKNNEDLRIQNVPIHVAHSDTTNYLCT
jgi:hypothetical protein